MEATSTNRVPRVSSLGELLRVRATEEPGRRAYTYLKDQSASAAITYGELDRRARAVAARLSGELSRGDRVLLLYPPGIDFLAGFFGCLYAGVIAAPLPLPGARGGLEKLALVRGDTEAKAALTVSELAEGKLGGAGVGDLLVLATDRIEETPAGSFPEPAEPVNPAYLQYTSGSTSAPRGVMVTHANVLHNLANIDDGFKHMPESVIVTWLPHFHDMGLIYGLLAPLYHGIPCYLMSPAAFVQRPLSWLEAITRFRATHSGGPNFAYDLCVRRIKPEERAALDLSSWKVAFNGAEPVHAETLERFSKAFASCGFRSSAFHPAYGLAEASLKVTGGSADAEPVLFRASVSALARNRVEPAPEDSTDTRVLVGCGRAGRDTKVLIVDPETLKPCRSGEVGEIWITDLINEAFPLIRYRLGDLIVTSDRICSCGRGLPLIEHTLRAFSRAPRVDEIILVVRAGEEGKASAIRFSGDKPLLIVAGGKERRDSSLAGVKRAGGEIVLIHDGARPFPSIELIERVIDGAAAHGACIPVIPSPDTLRFLNDDGTVSGKRIDRSKIVRVQTPQGFRTDLIRGSLAESDPRIPDDAEALLSSGRPVFTVQGEPTNLKVTTPADLAIAEALAGTLS